MLFVVFKKCIKFVIFKKYIKNVSRRNCFQSIALEIYKKLISFFVFMLSLY